MCSQDAGSPRRVGGGRDGKRHLGDVCCRQGTRFGKSRVVELGQFRARSLSVGWPFILCLRSSGLRLFSSEFRPSSTFKESHGLGDIWSPNISGNSIPWSIFLAFRSCANSWDQAKAGCLGEEGGQGRGPPQRGAARMQFLWG